MNEFLKNNKKIIDQLSFTVVLRCVDKNDENIKDEDIYEISEKGNLIESDNSLFAVHTFKFNKSSIVLSASIDISWDFCCMKFKLKRSTNPNFQKIYVSEYRTLTVNIDKDVLENVIIRAKFIENLFSTHDITKWLITKLP